MSYVDPTYRVYADFNSDTTPLNLAFGVGLSTYYVRKIASSYPYPVAPQTFCKPFFHTDVK